MCSGRVTDPISIPWTGTRPRTGGSSCSSQRCSHQRAASTVPPTWKSAPWAVPSFGSLCEAVEQGAGDKTVARNAQAACMEVSATTRTASVCAPLDSLVPAVSRPAERAVLGRAARSSARAHQAAGASPSASRTPMAVLADLAGEEASARKPVPQVALGPTAASSASVRTAAPVTASAAASAPRGGMECTARSQTGSPRSWTWFQTWSSIWRRRPGSAVRPRGTPSQDGAACSSASRTARCSRPPRPLWSQIGPQPSLRCPAWLFRTVGSGSAACPRLVAKTADASGSVLKCPQCP